MEGDDSDGMAYLIVLPYRMRLIGKGMIGVASS